MCASMPMKMLFQISIFFYKLFLSVFGGTLASKPKPFKTSLCVTAALVGWQLVRAKVLKKFTNYKQHKFVTILHSLERVVPLIFISTTFSEVAI